MVTAAYVFQVLMFICLDFFVFPNTLLLLALVPQMVKNLLAMQDTQIPSLGLEDTWRREYPLQYSCLENPHGQRSLARYSPWGHKELDTTERLRRASHGSVNTDSESN